MGCKITVKSVGYRAPGHARVLLSSVIWCQGTTWLAGQVASPCPAVSDTGDLGLHPSGDDHDPDDDSVNDQNREHVLPVSHYFGPNTLPRAFLPPAAQRSRG